VSGSGDRAALFMPMLRACGAATISSADARAGATAAVERRSRLSPCPSPQRLLVDVSFHDLMRHRGLGEGSVASIR
jgi:hypothetical protein